MRESSGRVGENEPSSFLNRGIVDVAEGLTQKVKNRYQPCSEKHCLDASNSRSIYPSISGSEFAEFAEFSEPIASVCPKSPLFSKSRVFWQLDFRHLGSGWHDFQLALVGLAWFLVDVLAFNFRFRAIGAHFSLRLDAVACYCVPHAALESVLGGACACFSLSRPSKMLPKRCRLQDSTPSAA